MKRSPIKRKVKRLTAEQKRVRAIVAERSEGMCEAALREACEGRAANYHHILREGQGGEDTPENLRHLCGSGTTGCHGFIHHNVKWAKREGWLA